MTALYLASQSPRRAELLRTLRVEFQVLRLEIDETWRAGEAPDSYVTRLALAKATVGLAKAPSPLPVLAADTTVSVDDTILGKPADTVTATAMLRRLSGRRHAVFTGLALARPKDVSAPLLVCVRTCVQFRTLTDAEIACYCASGEPFDKAGGYGIQGLGGALIERIEGSYSNVVGLPLAETVALLNVAGVPHALR